MDNYINGSIAFTPEDVQSNKHKVFIDFLISMNMEFRVWTDGYCWIIDYLSAIASKEDNVHFMTNAEAEDWIEEVQKNYET